MKTGGDKDSPPTKVYGGEPNGSAEKKKGRNERHHKQRPGSTEQQSDYYENPKTPAETEEKKLQAELKSWKDRADEKNVSAEPIEVRGGAFLEEKNTQEGRHGISRRTRGERGKRK